MAEAASMVVMLLACTGGPLPQGDPARPDVILVSIDSLRADHLGSYGNARAVSPFLDALAAHGHRFTEARSMSPWTLPSHTTMLSGRSPLTHNVIEDDRRIPADLPLVQEAFSSAGFLTGGFVSTVYVSKLYGFDSGFGHFEDYGVTEDDNLRHPVRAERVVDDALAWAEQAKDKPVFLFVHLYDVHYPYLPPEPYNAMFDRPGSKKQAKYHNYQHYLAHPLEPEQLEHQIAQYDECIAYVDVQLRRLVEAFGDSGRKARVVVTADHGEEFGERGSWGHAHTLYPEVMRIPLIVSDALDAPDVRDARTGTLDIAATVAALGGVDFPSEGRNALDDALPPARDWPMETSRFDSARLGLLTGEGEATRRVDLDLAHERIELYAEAKDPRENSAIPDPNQAYVAALWDKVGEHWTTQGTVTTPGFTWSNGVFTQHQVVGPASFALYPPDAVMLGEATRDAPLPPSVTISVQTKEQLEALGYQQ
jgi:arylsulfatase